MSAAQAEQLEALMERYVDGDLEAYQTLYESLRGPIVSSLRRWLRTDHQIEDALQVTVLKLHTSRGRYRRGAPVLPWVLTIARNVAVDQLRSKSRREQQLDVETAEAIADDPATDRWHEEDEREVIAAVHAALETLPPGVREVVRLHKLEGKAMAEIAELLGIKEGAARVRAHRGYKALARALLGFRSSRD